MHFDPKPNLAGFCLESHALRKQRVPLAFRLAELVKYCSSEAVSSQASEKAPAITAAKFNLV